jgi:peptidoglycan/LPS O-acetylase OafA/YrhL
VNVIKTKDALTNSAYRIPELDGLRGIAILLVVIWHYAVIQIKAEPYSIAHYFQRALGLSWSGVDLFFVLSGFLIGGILIDNRETSNYFKVFFIHRVCRIFPLYFLCLSMFFVLTYALPDLVRTSPFDWLFGKPLPLWSYLTFTQNFTMVHERSFGAGWLGVTWSLAVEEQFYLVLPLMIYIVPTRKLPWVLLFFVLLAPVLRTIIFYNHPRPSFPTFMLMPCRADSLLIGVLCAYITRQANLIRFVKEHLALLYILCVILLLGVAALTVADQNVGSWAMTTYGYSIFACLYACVLLIAITEKRGIVSGITRFKALRSLGIIAFGVYLWHQVISGIIHALFLRQAPQMHNWLEGSISIIAILLTLIVAQVSWSFVEKPFVSMGHSIRWNRKRQLP